jgi:hypothetical protein
MVKEPEDAQVKALPMLYVYYEEDSLKDSIKNTSNLHNPVSSLHNPLACDLLHSMHVLPGTSARKKMM